MHPEALCTRMRPVIVIGVVDDGWRGMVPKWMICCADKEFRDGDKRRAQEVVVFGHS